MTSPEGDETYAIEIIEGFELRMIAERFPTVEQARTAARKLDVELDPNILSDDNIVLDD